jgi:hypothetical protein
MANDTGTLNAKRVEQGNHVFRMIGRTERFNRLVGFAKSPEVRSYERETILQALHQWLPCEPELRPSVQQEERVSSPSLGDMELSAIGANGQMLHLTVSSGLPF